MAEIGPPRSFPIMTLEELASRSYFESPHFLFNKSSVPLPPAGPSSRKNRPRLLACHDLKGGYVDDQWIQGCNATNPYTLKHWRLLDSFVYFSHNLVTLPPPGWVNAAHLHGVQVLGTFITEWAEGAKLCKEMLASEESARMFADRLAELAQALGFDGWLINIENAIEKNQIGALLEFVRHLTVSTHELVPQSLVIWYDSVTTGGSLTWQNRLDDWNKPFFDVCDGIFTNYTWQKRYANWSATVAGERAHDVYMGVDVFGRGTFGGGRYHCDVALKVAREAGVSAALFAPGWSYENNQDQKRWWDSIENCWPAARPDPIELPIFTDFDIGCGRGMFMDGEKVSDLPWYNLSCQNLQPLLRVAGSTDSKVMATACQGPVYNGGVCVKVIGDVGENEIFGVQLFQTETIIEEVSLNVSYSVMLEEGSTFCLALVAEDPTGAKVIHCLLDTKQTEKEPLPSTHQFPDICAFFHNAKGGSSTSSQIEGARKSMPRSFLKGQTGASFGGTVWSLREYVLDWGQSTLTDVLGICTSAKDIAPILIKLLQDKEITFDKTVVGTKMQTNVEQVDKVDSSVPVPRRLLGPAQVEPGPEQQPWYTRLFSNFLPEVEETAETKFTSGNYSVNLGHLSIASSNHVHLTLPDPELTGHDPSWVLGAEGEKILSIALGWELPSSNSDCSPSVPGRYHLFVDMEVDLSSPSFRYLGMTMLGAFYVYGLPVPNASSTVTFHLQRQCGCGKVQPLPNGSTYSLQVQK